MIRNERLRATVPLTSTVRAGTTSPSSAPRAAGTWSLLQAESGASNSASAADQAAARRGRGGSTALILSYAGPGRAAHPGSSWIFCQILRDIPVVSVSIVLTVSRTTGSCDCSAHSAAVLPTRLSSSEQ